MRSEVNYLLVSTPSESYYLKVTYSPGKVISQETRDSPAEYDEEVVELVMAYESDGDYDVTLWAKENISKEYLIHGSELHMDELPYPYHRPPLDAVKLGIADIYCVPETIAHWDMLRPRSRYWRRNGMYVYGPIREVNRSPLDKKMLSVEEFLDRLINCKSKTKPEDGEEASRSSGPQ